MPINALAIVGGGPMILPSTMRVQSRFCQTQAAAVKDPLRLSISWPLGFYKMAGLDASSARVANRALAKMNQGLSWLRSSGDLESAMGMILAEQCKAADQKCGLTRQRISDRFEKLRQHNLKEQETIRKRIEAEKSSKFWSKLIDFFKGLAAALSAVSSIFTGPVGIAAASLMIASLIVSYTVPGDLGKYLSLGLGLAGAACGLASAFVQEAIQGIGRWIALASRISASVCEGAAAASTIVEASSQKNALNAQAEWAEIRTMFQKQLTEAEEEKEDLKLLIDAQERGVHAVVRALESQSRVGLKSVDPRRAP